MKFTSELREEFKAPFNQIRLIHRMFPYCIKNVMMQYLKKYKNNYFTEAVFK